MLSLQNFIKYLGLAIIIFFLIKAFTDNKLDNTSVCILVIIIMALIMFLIRNTTCVRSKNEHYQITDPPIVDSIYPGPDNIEMETDILEPMKPDIKEKDQDIQDFKDIMAIDKETYQKLIKNEKNAEEQIREKQRDEMVYTNTHPFNTIPLGTQLYGYTYLPPENWFRAYERPPVCVTNKRCPTCPIAEGGSTSNLMEFDTSNNVVGPDGINLRYVKKILNKNQ
jgi:hypothetical protein